MKNLKSYIQEAFRVNQDHKPDQYTCHPKDKKELVEILKERLKDDPDADLNDIDISNVKDMSGLFAGVNPHDIDISDWDVSNVENMMYMFYECKNFNCDLSKWNVSNVEDMHCMFESCRKFEGKGLDKWKIPKETRAFSMFEDCPNLKTIPDWFKSYKDKI